MTLYRWATATDIGLNREHNEDAVAPLGSGESPGPQLIAVADGLGGLDAGEEASSRAVDAATASPAGNSVSLVERIHAADRAVADFATRSSDVSNCATTLVLAELQPDRTLDIAHAGDSRLYLFGGDEFVQVTTDQTVAQELVDRGVISASAADDHPKRHVLTSACGLPDIKIEHIAGIELRMGDRVLICSDGLTEMVMDDEIAGILSARTEPQDTVRALIDAANEYGGTDNITVALIDVME